LHAVVEAEPLTVSRHHRTVVCADVAGKCRVLQLRQLQGCAIVHHESPLLLDRGITKVVAAENGLADVAIDGQHALRAQDAAQIVGCAGKRLRQCDHSPSKGEEAHVMPNFYQVPKLNYGRGRRHGLNSQQALHHVVEAAEPNGEKTCSWRRLRSIITTL
jgi:hypothetical protein